MIRIYCEAADAVLKETQTLTAGMTNYPECVLTFSDAWDGFGKAVVVRAGEVEKSVLVVNNKFTVPHECLADSGVNLIVGVSGTNGTQTIPTIWCSCGTIMDSVDIDESAGTGTATPSLVDQMLAYAQQISDYAEDLDLKVIRSVEVNNTNADKYGVASVGISDTGASANRTLTFTFANLKGNGLESIAFVSTGTNTGRVVVTESNGNVTNYDGIKDALEYVYNYIDHNVSTIITDYIELHPEYVTTVMDGAVSYQKLDTELQGLADIVRDLDTIPTRTSDLINDSDFVSDVNYVHTDSNYTGAEKAKLEGIEAGAQVNTITGIKGNDENSYRTGNVNLTPANIGAVPATRKVNNKALSSDISLNSSDITDDSDAGGATVKESLNNLKGSLNSIQGQINAYVENGDTASRAYGEGGYVVWKGSLYRVAAFIASGNSFTVGTNIVPCTVSTELYAANRDSGWITLYDNSPEYIKYRRIGNLIFVSGNVSSNGTQLVTKATLPTGYRPSERAFTSIESTNGTGIPNAYISIPTSGAIQLIDWEKTAKPDLYFKVVYPL